MGFFTFKKNDIRYGVVVDIGSGSVVVSIIASDIEKPYPEIIWSKREYSPLRKSFSPTDAAKSVMTSLMNALMSLDGEGRKRLQEVAKGQTLDYLQVTVAAPWSYTVTKTISYKQEETFEVTKTLLEELLRTASKKVEEEMLENEKVQDLGLSIVAKTTLQVIANGYPVTVTGKQKANTLKVIQASSVAQEYLLDAIDDARDKILPGTELSQYSFMLPYFLVIQDIVPPGSDYCLVDLTYEATEIGIVREGILTYCTHTPYGAFTLAREIADAISVPLEEAYGYLTNEELSEFTNTLSETKKEAVENIFLNYQIHLSELFKETGDELAIPKRIYVHGNLQTEPFFNAQVQAAAKMATKMPHATYNVTGELLTKNFPTEVTQSLKEANQDTALLISAQFFHTREYRERFEQL